MPDLCLQLDEVDWAAVASAALDPRESTEIPPHVRADALSLSALFARDYHEGLGRIALARQSEPLNPLHSIRMVLFLLRFGASARALDLARSLQEQLPGIALPAYLRALATHRQGEYRRAANAAAEVVDAHPAFVLARFLQAESQLRSQFKGLGKLLTGLPRGESHAPAWLDLVAKLLLSAGEEAHALAGEIAANPSRLPPNSREKALADDLIELSRAPLEVLEERLAATPANSRSEEMVLLFAGDRFDDRPTLGEAVEALRRLSSRFPDRPAVRRLYAARLTRMAVDLAGRERYPEALRVVERCLQLEPHETVHYQNRAALFTLLREPQAYHDAWFELDRHHYRLALLGRITPADASSMARPHRLFAQQARLPAEGPGGSGLRQNPGFLKESTRSTEGGSETILAVNQERIDEDPELLRQWFHHRRAELTFRHWSLGLDPRRFLLDPEDATSARSRLSSLASCSRSLVVLVPEEGRLLASRLVAAWDRRGGEVDPAYAPPSDDPEARALKLLHLETMGDLALLCLTWNPDGRRPGLVEDILGMLRDEGAFFDDGLLYELLQGRQVEESYPLKLLAGFINDTLGLDPTRPIGLTREQRAGVLGRLAGDLLTRLAYRTYEEFRGMEFGAQRALAFLQRARGYDPENVRTELTVARFLLLAGHDAEASATLAKLQKSARAREPEIHSEIEELRQILSERAWSGVGSRPRPAGASESIPDPSANLQVGDLESEIERFPGSIQPYEELARKLAAEGRFQDALDWSDRAMTQCLGRDGQLRARSLNIEVLGLRKLGERDRGAVRLYLTGAHRPALEVLEGVPDGDAPDYTLDFLLGHCRLAIGQPDRAQHAFERALAHCGKQLHRTVLRGLAMDVDQPFLAVARRSIADKIGVGAFEAALREALAMMAHLRRPEPALVDLAQVHLDAAVARMGTSHPPLPSPTGPELEFCGGQLAEAYGVGSDLERARRIARLSLSAHEPSRRKAELILRKVDALEEQAALAEMLARSGTLLRQGDFAGALAALDGAGSIEPRVVRQRALLLLKLERFEEADAAASGLNGSSSPVAREFLESYPSLGFRQRIATASRMLRAGDSARARAVLDGTVATNRDEAVELAYCRGFGLIMDAYRLRNGGDPAGAREAFVSAMDCVEPQVAAARSTGHARLIELYEKLDKELDH